MSDQPIIDQEAISNLKELNPGDGGEFLKEIISIYIEDTPKRIAELKASLASADVPGFTRAAHTIKGSSANVGASAMRALCERLEFTSKREGLGSVGAQVANVEAEFAKAAAELKRISGA